VSEQRAARHSARRIAHVISQQFLVPMPNNTQGLSFAKWLCVAGLCAAAATGCGSDDHKSGDPTHASSEDDAGISSADTSHNVQGQAGRPGSSTNGRFDAGDAVNANPGDQTDGSGMASVPTVCEQVETAECRSFGTLASHVAEQTAQAWQFSAPEIGTLELKLAVKTGAVAAKLLAVKDGRVDSGAPRLQLSAAEGQDASTTLHVPAGDYVVELTGAATGVSEYSLTSAFVAYETPEAKPDPGSDPSAADDLGNVSEMAAMRGGYTGSLDGVDYYKLVLRWLQR